MTALYDAILATPVVHRAVRACEALRAAIELVEHATLADRTGDAVGQGLWKANIEATVFALSRPPSSDADLSLQVGLAASFVGIVCEAAEEDTTARALGLAISSLLENATLYLADRPGCPADLLPARSYFVEQAKVCGAERAA